jgi:two-component system, OmpR family, sensor kinase
MRHIRLSLFSKLYVRIWLAVAVSVLMAVALVMVAWQLSIERQGAVPLRELVLRNAAGEVVGKATAAAPRVPGQGVEFTLQLDQALAAGEPLVLQLPPRRNRQHNEAMEDARRARDDEGRGPGAGMHRERSFERPQSFPAAGRLPDWLTPPFGFVWWMVLASVVVALAAYPVIRKLTSRLEELDRGVQRWGRGELSLRVPENGHDEVAGLAKRFNAAAEQIEQLLLSHKALLANASHELRSPLARIRMGMELLSADEGVASLANSKLKDEIKRSISELDQLIDEILLASRLDAANADTGAFESVDLTGLAAEEAARTGARLEADAVTVQGSGKLLRRLIRNLLENAAKYASPTRVTPISDDADDDAIQITVRQGVVSGRPCAILWVEDRGPGVPVEQRQRIFEPFYRMSGASEKDGGVGLGLALVKSIAHRHGGKVVCEDRLGGGARFVVEIPISS